MFGIDPSPTCVQEAEKTPGVRGFVGSLSEMPKAVSPYNVVVLSHVLEHVRDVHPALENLKVQMRTGSLLYVEVPDAARYADYAWSPFQDFNTEHINHFSPQFLSATCYDGQGFGTHRSVEGPSYCPRDPRIRRSTASRRWTKIDDGVTAGRRSPPAA